MKPEIKADANCVDKVILQVFFYNSRNGKLNAVLKGEDGAYSRVPYTV